MGYAIELSFDVKKVSGYTQHIDAINTKARKYGCSSHYSMHEIEGIGRKTTRNESILVLLFEEEDETDNMYRFIKEIRVERLGYIDCIYRDEVSCNLLYASPKYLRRLDKKTSLDIRRSIKKSDDLIIEGIKNAMKVK